MLHPAAIFFWLSRWGLLRVSECSEEQSARSSAITCGGQCLGDKRNHLTGKVSFCCMPSWANALQPLLQPIPLNPGNTASLKRLIFESQTLVCHEVKLKANRKDHAAHTTLAVPERDGRVQQQKNRLTGFLFRGEEECSHSSYDITLAMLEKDCLIYLGPEKFPTRCSELTQKKARKEISIDQ